MNLSHRAIVAMLSAAVNEILHPLVAVCLGIVADCADRGRSAAPLPNGCQQSSVECRHEIGPCS
jgi:hypothetical protein